jgi:hypothetical protein
LPGLEVLKISGLRREQSEFLISFLSRSKESNITALIVRGTHVDPNIPEFLSALGQHPKIVSLALAISFPVTRSGTALPRWKPFLNGLSDPKTRVDFLPQLKTLSFWVQSKQDVDDCLTTMENRSVRGLGWRTSLCKLKLLHNSSAFFSSEMKLHFKKRLASLRKKGLTVRIKDI